MLKRYTKKIKKLKHEHVCTVHQEQTLEFV